MWRSLQKFLLLILIGISLTIILPTQAKESLSLTYPPKNHQTTSSQIFFIGTAPKSDQVLINGQPIDRSSDGHFAPSFPLQIGDNNFELKYKNESIKVVVKRLPIQGPAPKEGFVNGSLFPQQNIAQLPGESLCFGAIAPTKSNISVEIAGKNIPLKEQEPLINLPDNKSVLIDNNQPQAIYGAGQYLGCTVASVAADLGYPIYKIDSKLAKDSMNNNPTPALPNKPATAVVNNTFHNESENTKKTSNSGQISQTAPGKIEILSPSNLEVAEVIVNNGIARTGPSSDYSRITPLPKGTKATITAKATGDNNGKPGNWVRLDYGGWILTDEIKIVADAAPPKTVIKSITSRQREGVTDIIFPLQVPVPLSVEQGDRTFTLTLYNTTAQTDIIKLSNNPLISRMDWRQIAPEQVQYRFNLKTLQQWGYKMRYEGSTLILSLRHPPQISNDRNQPLKGIKILLDPGHGGKDSGAIGATGYDEKTANLYASKLLANELTQRGATVYLTREIDRDLSLAERVNIIDNLEPHIALSVHHNALPDGGNPAATKGFSTFWYHPQAQSLAMIIHNLVVESTGRNSYGVFWDNLALARPYSAPSVLLELGFMSNPEELQLIMQPQEQEKMAKALANAITQWFLTVK